MDEKDRIREYLRRRITRRQAVKAGALATLGLVFSRPLIDTIIPTPLFAQYEEPPPPGPAGCTPGKWKNDLDFWPATVDPDTATVGGTFFVGSPPIDSEISLALGANLLTTALAYPGGSGKVAKARNLLRIGTASFLNEVKFGAAYPSPGGDVVAYVRGALVAPVNEAEMESRQNTLDILNNDADCEFLVDGG